MPKEIPKKSQDEMTTALRKALVECGAIIPITPDEVELAQRHLTPTPTPNQVDAAFARLEATLNDGRITLSFMNLDDCVVPPTNGGLAMAARNGTELDAETLAKIEKSVSDATRKPSQT